MGWLGISHLTPLPQSLDNRTHPLIENQKDIALASNLVEAVHYDKAKETCSTRGEVSSEGNIFSVIYVIVRDMIIVPHA